MKRVVMRVDPSPMNAKRWVLTLACGHEVWVTSGKKPTRKNANCSECDKSSVTEVVMQVLTETLKGMR